MPTNNIQLNALKLIFRMNVMPFHTYFTQWKHRVFTGSTMTHLLQPLGGSSIWQSDHSTATATVRWTPRWSLQNEAGTVSDSINTDSGETFNSKPEMFGGHLKATFSLVSDTHWHDLCLTRHAVLKGTRWSSMGAVVCKMSLSSGQSCHAQRCWVKPS